MCREGMRYRMPCTVRVPWWYRMSCTVRVFGSSRQSNVVVAGAGGWVRVPGPGHGQRLGGWEGTGLSGSGSESGWACTSCAWIWIWIWTVYFCTCPKFHMCFCTVTVMEAYVY